MPLIDDEGNLFGVVNVIDALAVVLLLAVIVAGIAFVGVLGNGEPETRYATVDLGGQPDYVADRVSEGDTVRVDGSSHNLTVTDVYVTPAMASNSGNQSQVTVRTKINGETVEVDDRDERVFKYAGERLRVGAEVAMDTDDYTTTGRLTSLESDGSSLTVDETPVLLESTISDRTAEEISENDTVTLGSYTTATITNVRLYPIGGDRYRALVGTELNTHQQGSMPTYGGQTVTVGSQINLSPDGYDLNGEVVRRGSDQEIGNSTTINAEIEIENIQPAVADEFSVGMTETVRDETLVTIQSVDTEAADTVLESESGEIYLREHPKNKDVTLSVELQTRRTDTGVRFHGDSLRTGDSVVLDFGTTTVSGTVTQIE
ncbi:DUF4330 family protein [Natrinema longum]|uniref:DUF4330 family protein n=1 Tax=Natrinema longum TaxID=370324 RepID=A0A8A2UAD1_9EURY|nr:DUF4330 family protein [Natrinema longum]MBZ6496474.1 DUF4330 domain-containing protein [Natrinema longum]QSW85620.1 DUF4330 family protein [Natrinema longum]